MKALGKYATALAVGIALLCLATVLEVVFPNMPGHHFWTYMAGWQGGLFLAWITRRRPA